MPDYLCTELTTISIVKIINNLLFSPSLSKDNAKIHYHITHSK